MVIAAVVGVLVGLAVSWTGGRTDAAFMRLADVQLAFPVIMLCDRHRRRGRNTPSALIGVLALSGWVLYARTIRAHVLTVRRLEYIEAAHTLGAGDLRVVLRHVLPNTVAPILVIGSSPRRWSCWKSGLSFLGLGIQPPQSLMGLDARRGP